MEVEIELEVLIKIEKQINLRKVKRFFQKEGVWKNVAIEKWGLMK